MTHGALRDQPLTGRLIQRDHRARRESAEARACVGEDGRAAKRAREPSTAALLDGSVGASHLQRIPKLKKRAVFIEPAEQGTRVIPQVVGWNVPDLSLTGTGEYTGSPGRERIHQNYKVGVVRRHRKAVLSFATAIGIGVSPPMSSARGLCPGELLAQAGGHDRFVAGLEVDRIDGNLVEVAALMSALLHVDVGIALG